MLQTIETLERAGPERILANDWIEIEDASGLPIGDTPATIGNIAFDGTGFTVSVGIPLAEVERQVILSTLKFCRENKRDTARMLGMSLKTLYARLALYKGLSHSTGETS